MRSPSRTIGLVAALALLTALAFSTTPATAEAASTTPRVTLASQDVWVGPSGKVTATLDLRDVPDGSTLAPFVYGSVPTRSAFALTVKGDALPGTGQALAVHRLAKGESQVTVRFRVDDGTTPPEDPPPTGDVVTWTAPGVHPIAFEVHAADGSTVDTVISYVVRLAARPTTGTSTQLPLRVATELRLDAPPSVSASGRVMVTPTTRREVTALIDGFAGTTDAPTDTNGFAFSIRPELVDALARSAEPSDRELVTRLDDVTADHPLQRLSWVAIDLDRWLVTAELANRATDLLSTGDATTERVLHAPDASVADLPAWHGTPTDAQVDWLVKSGASGVLVSENDLGPLDPSAFPRSLAAPFSLDYGKGRKVTAVQLDAALSGHFTAEDPVLGANHLIADLAVMALDLPALSRGVVVAPPRGWTPAAAFIGAYAEDLAAASPAGAVPLITPTTPAAVLNEVPAARAAGDVATEGDPLVRELRAGRAPAPLDDLARELDRTQAKVVSLSTMAPGGASRSATISTYLLRRVDIAASADLRTRERDRHLSAVRSTVDDLVQTVRLPANQTITLTSDTADIPLTIHRTATGPTMIRLEFDTNPRLTFAKGNSQLVRLSDDTTQLRIRVHSDSPGDSIVQVTATSPNGTLLVGTSKLVVRSTAASGMGLVISFGSLGFLLVWWARDIFRGRHRRRASRIRPADLIDV